MPTEFRLPELAENVTNATLTRILVAVGDVIAAGQPLIEVETDKAAAEVPSSLAGKVLAIHVKEGQTLKVGDAVLVVEEGVAASTGAPAAASPPAPAPAPASTPTEPTPQAKEETPAAPALAAARPAGEPAAAGPSVRRLAREIGVDIDAVPGSGPGGRVTAEDVKEFSRRMHVEAPGASARPVAAAGPAPVFAKFGEVERQQMSGVRRRTAENMTLAWTTIPQVTQFDKADITDLEAFRHRHGKRVEAAGGKLTVTAILVKVLAAALRRFPQFNASVDMANNEIVLKKYYNIGVAVDTDRGLIVPVVREAEAKSLLAIAIEISALAQRARDRKLTLDELQGGTFTISNLGGIGGTAFSPIVNPPEVAILGVSRSQIEPVFREGQFVPRTMMPLSLTYDHRVIDGADGARFLRWIVEALEQPLLMALEA